jgi:hypothetical protein
MASRAGTTESQHQEAGAAIVCRGAAVPQGGVQQRREGVRLTSAWRTASTPRCHLARPPEEPDPRVYLVLGSWRCVPIRRESGAGANRARPRNGSSAAAASPAAVRAVRRGLADPTGAWGLRLSDPQRRGSSCAARMEDSFLTQSGYPTTLCRSHRCADQAWQATGRLSDTPTLSPKGDCRKGSLTEVVSAPAFDV